MEKSWGSLLDEEQGNGKPWNGGSMVGMATLLKRRAQYIEKAGHTWQGRAEAGVMVQPERKLGRT